jgi:radical SAM superfamily enzyme YgiQ (UPF0313 family)
MHNSQDYKEQRNLNFTPEENLSKISNEIDKIFSKKKINKILLISPPQFQTSNFDLEMFDNRRYFNYPPYGIGLLKAAIQNVQQDVEIKIIDLNHDLLSFLNNFLKKNKQLLTSNKNSDFNKKFKTYLSSNYEYSSFELNHQNETDLTIEDIMEPILVKYLKEFKPDLIGISCMFTMLHKRMIKIANISKKCLPDTKIFVGGVHPTSSSELILDEEPSIDFVNLFEGDISLPKFIEYVNSDNKDKSQLKQIGMKIDGKYLEIQNRSYPAGHTINLRPDYGDLKINEFSSLGEIGAYRFWWRENTIASTILSNRGCRARCSFCSVRSFNGKGVRGRTYLSVVDELQYLKEVHGVNHVMWLDDDLLFDRERTINMFNEIVKRNLDITWDASNGIIASALKDEVLEAAAESGCIGMHFGIESGNDEILKSVHKPSGKKHYLELANKLKKYPQIFTKGFLMVGFPNETLSQMQETIDMAVKINLDWYTIQVVHPLPKTEMHQQMVEMGLITDDKVEDEKLNYGNRSGKRKKIEQGSEISQFNDPFKGDLNLVPKKELMEDIWFTADFKINYERIVNIYDNKKLKKLKCFLEYISKKISTKNPLVVFYIDLINKRLHEDSFKKMNMDLIKDTNIFWKSRLDVLMKDTYDML